MRKTEKLTPKTSTPGLSRSARILANAAFFVANGSVEATWRTYRGHRLGPYFRVRCRQRSGRRAVGTGAAPRPAAIYLGRSPELAARVGKLLEDLQQHTRCKRHCEEMRRQVRRSLTGAKQELRRLLAQRGTEQKWFERIPRASGKRTPLAGGSCSWSGISGRLATREFKSKFRFFRF